MASTATLKFCLIYQGVCNFGRFVTSAEVLSANTSYPSGFAVQPADPPMFFHQNLFWPLIHPNFSAAKIVLYYMDWSSNVSHNAVT